MEETVYCQIAGAAVPPEVCDKEQGGFECRGCVAPTRRCTHCKQLRSIREPKAGLCATCALSVPQEPERERLSVADALEGVATAMSNPSVTSPLGRPSEAQATSDISQAVVDAINALPSGQRTVLTLRLGLDGKSPCTIVKTCVRANLSQTYVVYTTREALEALIGQIGESQVYRLRQMMPGSKAESRVKREADRTVLQQTRVKTPTEPADMVQAAIRSLSLRQAECMRLRLGIGTAHPLHTDDVAQMMKVTPGCAYTMQSTALGRLRQLMTPDAYERMVRIMPRKHPGSQSGASASVVPAVRPPAVEQPTDDIENAIAKLPLRTAEYMRLRLGIGTGTPMSDIEAAQAMKVKSLYIWSYKARALRLLEGMLTPEANKRVVDGLPNEWKIRQRQKHAAVDSAAPAVVPELPAAYTSPVVTAPAGNTLGDVYAHLLRRAVVIGDERVVRGAVTFLQIDCGLRKDEVVAILQKLESQGAIEARDGWRTVVLKADAVESTEVVVHTRRGRFGRRFGPALLPPAVPAAVTADMDRLKQELLCVQDERTSLTARLEKLEEQPKPAGESEIRASVDKLDARLVNLEILLGNIAKKIDNVAAPPTSASQDAPPAQGQMVLVEDPVVRLADEDGFFEAGGEWWGHISGLEKRLGIPMPTLYSRIRTSVVRVRRGRSCKGKKTQFFAVVDVERACADPLDKKGAGAAPRVGRPPEFATTGELMKRFKVGMWTLQSRIDASVRTQNGRTASGGPATLYCVADVKRALAPILRLPVAASGGITRRGVRYESIRAMAVQFKQHESSVGTWIRNHQEQIRSIEGRNVKGQIRTFYCIEDAKRLLLEQVNRQFS